MCVCKYLFALHNNSRLARKKMMKNVVQNGPLSHRHGEVHEAIVVRHESLVPRSENVWCAVGACGLVCAIFGGLVGGGGGGGGV